MNILIHGFNVKDPQKTVGKITPYLKYSVIFDYGWRFFSILWHNKKDAKRLRNITNKRRFSDNVIVFAHSNGAAIAVESARQGAKIDKLICINPALKNNTAFPKSIKKIIVIHTKHDKATKAARFFERVPLIGILIPNAWGDMGAVGFTGDDDRVINWDLSETLNGHSDIFKNENLELIMPQLLKML